MSDQDKADRQELRNLLDKFPLSSRSQELRILLSDCIVALYCAKVIDRTEYHNALAEIV